MMSTKEPTRRAGDAPRTRVAVIGTGLAGLTTAYLLQTDDKERYAVALFEKAGSLSFDSASISVKNDKTGDSERIDLPMRALAGGYYANLLRMYHHLDIPLHPIRFLFVFARAFSTTDAPKDTNQDAIDESAHGTYFVHASNLHQMLPPWPGTRGALSHLAEILYLIICYFWFTVACFFIPPLASSASSNNTKFSESLAEYLARIRIPRRYVSHYLLPLMSSVSTCSHQEMLAFPASDIVNYKKRSHWQQHYTVCGGVKQVQLRLTKEVKDIRLNTRVVKVIPEANQSGVTIRWQSTTDESAQIAEERFDRVVLAVSPDVAGNIFRPLKSAMQKMPTIQVESSVLCREMVKLNGSDVQEPTICSHHVGDTLVPQVLTLRTLFSKATDSRTEALHTMPTGVVVQTCPLDGTVDAKRAMHTAWFTRTLRTTESRAVVERITGRWTRAKTDGGPNMGWVNGEDNVWLTGAWCWDGMVLLEGCVVSSIKVADDFGVKIPWQRD